MGTLLKVVMFLLVVMALDTIAKREPKNKGRTKIMTREEFDLKKFPRSKKFKIDDFRKIARLAMQDNIKVIDKRMDNNDSSLSSSADFKNIGTIGVIRDGTLQNLTKSSEKDVKIEFKRIKRAISTVRDCSPVYEFNIASEQCICTRSITWFTMDEAGPCKNRITCTVPGQVIATCSPLRSCILPGANLCPNGNIDEFVAGTGLVQNVRSEFPNEEDRIASTSIIPCSVSGFTLRNCTDGEVISRMISFVVSRSGTTFFLETSVMRELEHPRDIGSYLCGPTCDVSKCVRGDCFGDAVFCDNFGCSGIEQDCNCKQDPSTTELILITPRGEASFVSWGAVLAEIEVPNTNLDLEMTDCETCSIVCSQNNVEINAMGQVISVTTVSKDGFTLIERVGTDKFSIRLPLEMALRRSEAEVKMWFEGYRLPYSKIVDCPGSSVCNAVDCFFCNLRWSNVQCYNGWNWILIILMAIVLTIIAYYLLLIVLFLTRWLWRSSKLFKGFFLFFGRAIKKLWCYLKEKSNKAIKRINDESKIQEERGMMSKEKSKLKKKNETRSSLISGYNSPASKPIIYFAVILSIIKPYEFCAQMNTLSIQQESCQITNSGNVECTISQSVRLAGVAVRQTTCFILRNSEGVSIGSFQARILNLHLQCDYARMYYTAMPRVIGLSHGNCYSAGHCYNDNCSRFDRNNAATVFPESLDRLRVARCQGHAGCWSNSCMTCKDGCLFMGAIFDSDSRIYEVGRCTSWNIGMDIEFSTFSNSNFQSSEVNLYPGYMHTIREGITVSLVSFSNPGNPIENDCIVRDGRSAAVSPCNREFEYTKGRLGEIQCPTNTSALRMDNSCSMADDLVEFSVSNWLPSLSYNLINPETILNQRKLPLQIPGGSVVREDMNGTIFTEYQGNALFEIQLDLRDYNIVFKSDKSRCFGVTRALSGCYSCISGATLEIEGWTDFGSALASVSCTGLNLNTVLNLDAMRANHVISFQSHSSNVRSTCQITCPGGVTTFDVSGGLEWIGIDDARENGTLIGPGNGSDTSIDLLSFFISPWAIAMYVIWGVLIIGVLSFLVITVIRRKRVKGYSKII